MQESHRLLRATQLPFPTDWATLFNGDATQNAERPLIVEIGFGYGQYLRHLSQHHPDAHIIGLEIANVCLEKAERAIARGDLPNVRVIFARAETALRHLFRPSSIDALHINFPDPWFKSRHEHRRLMQPETLAAMISRLKTGARLYLATDIIEYAEMSAEAFAQSSGLVNVLDAPWVNVLPGRTTTKYEARAIREGRECYYFVYERTAEAVPYLPVIEDVPMPHIVLNHPLTLEAIRSAFSTFEHREAGANVHFMNIFAGDKSLLIDTFVDEPTIEQRVALILIQHEDQPNSYTLRLGTIGSPRPTEGMHVAVRRLSEWLMSLHPEVTVTQSKLREPKTPRD